MKKAFSVHDIEHTRRNFMYYEGLVSDFDASILDAQDNVHRHIDEL